ncbi:MAG: hypothetical protein ABJB98_05175 [Actinomycetota bacterium]
MRIYLPATTAILQRLVDDGEIGRSPLTAFAVTPALREWYSDDDVEALEFAALLEAARASLRLVDADPAARRRRVVIAADVADAEVTMRDDLDRGVVVLTAPVRLSAVASAHIDDPDAEPAIAAAAAASLEADLGHVASQEAVDDAEGFELSWYASQEIPVLLDLL